MNENNSSELNQSQKEFTWVIWFAIIVMLITTLPYLVGYTTQDDQYQFTGFVFGVEDGNSYIAKMLAGAYGAWLFRTPYTAYAQGGVLAYLPYTLLGKLAWPPGLHEQLVVLYHLFRFIAGLMAILATYDFIRFFVGNIRLRRFGLAMAILGGGLGWILVFLGRENWLGSLPLEFYSPESFGFLSLFGIPHLSAARAFLFWTLLAYLKLWDCSGSTLELDDEQRSITNGTLTKNLKRINQNSLYQGTRFVFLLSFYWMIAGILQPLVMVIIGIVIFCHLGILAIWQLWRRREGLAVNWTRWKQQTRLVIIAGLLPGLFTLYNFTSFMNDPFISSWIAQNILPSPHAMHYLIAYGIVIPYAWFGGRRLLKLDPWNGSLPVIWIIIFPLLAYAPFSIQRRLPESIWVVLVVLTMIGMQELLDRKRNLNVKPGVGVFIPLILLFPSTLLLLWGGFLAAGNARQPLFRHIDEISVFENLRSVATPGEIVLASYQSSNPLPAWTPQRVLIGHGPESVNQAILLPEVNKFFLSQTPDTQRQKLIDQYDVNYVFWGPAERLLGDWKPSKAEYLNLIHQEGEYSLYQVIRDP